MDGVEADVRQPGPLCGQVLVEECFKVVDQEGGVVAWHLVGLGERGDATCVRCIRVDCIDNSTCVIETFPGNNRTASSMSEKGTGVQCNFLIDQLSTTLTVVGARVAPIRLEAIGHDALVAERDKVAVATVRLSSSYHLADDPRHTHTHRTDYLTAC